jgi:hypothetical protein
VEPNVPEPDVAKETRERARRKSMSVGKSQQVVVRQHSAGNGSERTPKRGANARVCLTVGHAQGERSSRVEQLARTHRRCARIGELLERVPDRDDVESPSRDVSELADGNAKSHPTREGGGTLIHVETFERPPGVACRAEERAHVASDLESRAAPAMCSFESSHLRAVRAPLIVMQGAKGRFVGQLACVGLDQLDCPLAWIAVNERALPAPREAKRRVLRECDAIGERALRSPRSQPLLVELPQHLDLGLHIIGARDLLGVVGRADGAGGEIV